LEAKYLKCAELDPAIEHLNAAVEKTRVFRGVETARKRARRQWTRR